MADAKNQAHCSIWNEIDAYHDRNIASQAPKESGENGVENLLEHSIIYDLRHGVQRYRRCSGGIANRYK